MRAHFHSDQPIKAFEQDELQMREFVDRLTNPVVDWPTQDSLVVGLYAPWGSGKTSVLNLLEATLLKAPFAERVLTVRFNPWLYEDTSTLLSTFFATLKEATRTTALLTPERRESLQTAIDSITAFAVPVFAPLLMATLGIPDLLTPATAAVKTAVRATLKTGEQKFDAEKKRAADILKTLKVDGRPGRLVVLVDDLDRAAPLEVRAMLKLVRLIADLPNVTYVLAMDYHRVRHLLSEGPDALGASYLEKIVQVAIPLPPVSRTRVAELLLDSAQRIVTQSAARAGEQNIERELARRAINPDQLIMWRVRTLRDRARLLNAYRFLIVASTAVLEINAVDALLVAFLQTFYPEVAGRLRVNRAFLTRDYGLSTLVYFMALDDKGRQRRHQRALAALLGTLGGGLSSASAGEEEDDEERFDFTVVGEEAPSSRESLEFVKVRAILFTLFPDLRSPDNERANSAKAYRRYNQIAAPERFDRYFSYANASDVASDVDADTWRVMVSPLLARTATASVDEFWREVASTAFRDQQNWSQEKLGDLLTKISDRDDEWDPKLIGPLAMLCAYAAVAGTIREGDVAELIRHFLRRLAEPGLEVDDDVDDEVSRALVPAAQQPAMREWLHRAFAVLVEGLRDPFEAVEAACEHVRLWSRREARAAPWKGGAKVPPDIRPVLDAGLLRARHITAAPLNVFDHTGSGGGGPIWRWRDLLEFAQDDLAEIRTYLHKILDEEPYRLPELLGFFAGWSDDTPSFRHVGLSEVRRGASDIFGWIPLLRATVRFQQEGYEVALPQQRLVGSLLELLARDAKGRRRRSVPAESEE